MNLSEIFIRRPIATTLIMLGILVFGIMGYRLLPVSDLPNVDFPTIQVSANLSGASPETMASSVATPLEKQFSTIAGLDSMNSVNTQGSSQITLQFDLNRDIDAAAQDVQSAIAKVQRQLPTDMTSPPSYQKVDPSASPVLLLSLTSPQVSLYQLDEYAESLMAQRISMVKGVAQVSVYGSQKYAVCIRLNPQKLVAKGIGIEEVSTSIKNSNVNLPSGVMYGKDRTMTLEANGQLFKADDYKSLIVAYQNGSPVRLEELANVYDSVENDKSAAWLGDQRAMVLAIQKQPGTNTVEVVESIRALIPSFQEQLPASVKLDVLYDRSQPIKESVHDVKFTLVLTICLVILVIFLFLKNISATIIPSLALPMSISGTFAVMYMMGYNLDNLSLMAITLSVGFVVDDAIVMLENIVRHMEQGEDVHTAALTGSKEIGFTILSMTLSLAAVFIPVLFMGGIVGRLFQEFAVTIAAAILVSGFISLTLTPMLCSRFLKPEAERRHGLFYKVTEAGFQGFLNLYDMTLKWVLKHKFLVLLQSFVLFGITIWLFMIVPKGFIPSQDNGQIQGSTEAAQGISFDAMVKNQKAVAEIIKKNPNVDDFMSSVGSKGTGMLNIRLKPRDVRKDTPEQVIEQLRPKLEVIPGIKVFLRNPPAINLGGRSANSLYQLTLQTPDTDELYREAFALESRLKEMNNLQDVSSNLQLKNPQITIDIDRDKAAALGVSPRKIEETLYYMYGSRQVSTIYAPNNDYSVIMELDPEYQSDIGALTWLHILSDSGKMVPLSAVAKYSNTVGPLSVNHSGQIPSVTLSFNIKSGVSLSEALDEVDKVTGETLPSTVQYSFQGTAQAFQTSMKGMGVLLIMAVLVIYMILGILYESFVHPVTILSGLPSAGLGALLTLLLFKTDLNIYAFVGIIMLVGLVKKNAIMMIDFALDAQRKDHKSPEESIYQGCLVRFRPIMMTTMAALMGTLPIALGLGAGAESRRPLGLAVVGGLVVSQLLTLYITPVYFIYLDKTRIWMGKYIKRK